MTDSIPEAAADLVDADRSEFDDEADFWDWVDGRVAQLQMTLDAQERRDEALSAKLDAVAERAEQAQERARRAEQVAAWGGIGYEGRLARVVETLIRRARDGAQTITLNGGKTKQVSTASIGTTETQHEDEQGNRYTRPGVFDLFDGAVSDRTCERYVRDLGDLPGFSVREPSRGGWGGGSEQMRLQLDLSDFRAAYGSEWDVEDLIADMEGDDA